MRPACFERKRFLYSLLGAAGSIPSAETSAIYGSLGTSHFGGKGVHYRMSREMNEKRELKNEGLLEFGAPFVLL